MGSLLDVTRVIVMVKPGRREGGKGEGPLLKLDMCYTNKTRLLAYQKDGFIY